MELSSNYNKAGSLNLKSSMPMEYSRGVLSNKWYLKREAEPRDFELWSGDKPNLQRSTYKILGKNLKDDIMLTETETRGKHEEALRIMKESRNIDSTRKMVDEKNCSRLEASLNSNGNVSDALLAHRRGHDQHHLETTYNKDYFHPNPELMNQKSEKAKIKEFESMVDNSWGYRKMVSHFSDIDAPKRAGINTFHIQHGEYPNQTIKHELMAKQLNNIFETKFGSSS